MITAIDTSVLIAIGKEESNAGEWKDVLVEVRREGELIICEVVAAEFFSLVMDQSSFHKFMSQLGVLFLPISVDSAVYAGRIFHQYRRQGGPRHHLIPDFLVGAHALKQADQLAAIDRGYLRRYFPNLKILLPR